jgi:DNA topoisomerase-1
MAIKKNRFKSLSWEGPQFPDPYKITPGFKLHGKQISPICEEMFDKLADWRYTDYWASPIFQRNAWASWKRTLPKELVSLKMADFDKEFETRRKIHEAAKATKMARPREEREAEKLEREAKKQRYGYATVDGVRTPIGGYLIEAPNFIIGRGDAVFTGCWKERVEPEQVTVNIVGDPVKTRELKAKGFIVVSNPGVIWLFHYKMNLVNSTYSPVKKVNFAPASEFIHENEESKYDKTMSLVGKWKQMSDAIKNGFKSPDIKTRQASGIAYLMMKTGIRIGGEGAKNEAGTVGASTLRIEHLSLNGNILKTNFKGKDSVTDKREIEIDSWAIPAFNEFLSGKPRGTKVFDKVSGGEASKLIKSVVPNASPKVFRTANACVVLVEELRGHPVDPSWSDVKKKAVLVKANLAAAKQLNHQKNVSKNYGEQEAKSKDRVAGAIEREKERQQRARDQLLKIKDQVAAAKQLWSGEKLRDKLASLKERADKIKAQVSRAAEGVEKARAALEMKKETKNIALGTSLGAYCSPKLVYSWCADVGLPPEKVYTKSLIAKQQWADSTPPSYWKTIKVPNTKLIESIEED